MSISQAINSVVDYFMSAVKLVGQSQLARALR